MSMVERVARAIRENDDACGGERHGQYWDDLARAALEAMREPTPTMLRAAVDNDNGDVYGETGFIGNLKIMWGSAIDAALSEQGE